MSEPAPGTTDARGPARPAADSELLSTLFDLGREVTAEEVAEMSVSTAVKV